MPDAEAPTSRRHSSLVAAGILMSRVSGLAREKLLAYYLGSGFGVDAFRAALRIPNLLQNLLGEGVLSASFIPVYARLVDQGEEERAGRVAGAVAGLLAAVAGALAVVGVVLAEPITRVIALGFPPDSAKFELTVTLVRILTPGVAFLVLSAWCLGILNSHRRFFLSYVAPVLWNAAMIAALVTFGLRGWDDRSLATALAWGAFVGGLLQFLVQLPRVLTLERRLVPSLDWRLPGVRRVLRALGPVVAGRGVVQLSAYVDVLIASFLATGAIAVLGYAQVLYTLPVSLFGMSVAAAELPSLSTMDHADRAAVVRRLEVGAARIAFFVLPSAVGFVVVGDLVVGALYQGGEFSARATTQVWVVLAAYAVGLLASTQSRLLQSALYGVGDTRRPAIYAAVRVVASAAVGMVLMLQFDQFQALADGVQRIGELPSFAFADESARDARENLFRLGAVGLAAGASVGAWLEYSLLRRRVADRFGEVRTAGGALRPIVLAATAAGLVALGLRPLLAGFHPLIGGPVVVAAAAITHVGVAAGLGVDEASDWLARLRRVTRR